MNHSKLDQNLVNPDELNYLPFIVSLNRCGGIVILLMIHQQEYTLNKTGDVNVRVLDMRRGINEVKALVKHMSW